MAKRQKKLKVVGHIGTPGSIVDALNEAAARAEADETLAIAIIEVRREGEILKTWEGHEDGFRHQLIAGAVYLMDDLKDEAD